MFIIQPSAYGAKTPERFKSFVALLNIDYGSNKLRLRIPRKQYPGILADFSNERVNQRSTFRLGVDGGKVSLGEHVPDDARSLTGVYQIVDEEPVVPIDVY